MYLNIGIDIAKNIHEVCFIDDSGKQIGKFMRIKNSRKSLEKFRNKVDSLSKELDSNPRIGIEATGIYWALGQNSLILPCVTNEVLYHP
jgi:transposase